MAVRSRQGIVILLLVVASVGACGSSAATPSPSPTATPLPSASVQSSAPSPSATAPEASPAATAQIYVMRKGDTLIAIAKKFHITLEALRAANPKVTDPRKIPVGYRLVIPLP